MVLVAHVGFGLALDRCLVVVIGEICDLGADAPQYYDNTMEFDYTILARLSSKDISGYICESKQCMKFSQHCRNNCFLFDDYDSVAMMMITMICTFFCLP